MSSVFCGNRYEAPRLSFLRQQLNVLRARGLQVLVERLGRRHAEHRQRATVRRGARVEQLRQDDCTFSNREPEWVCGPSGVHAFPSPPPPSPSPPPPPPPPSPPLRHACVSSCRHLANGSAGMHNNMDMGYGEQYLPGYTPSPRRCHPHRRHFRRRRRPRIH